MEDEDVTLYAKWKTDSYTVNYDGNGSTGGTVPTDSNSYEPGDMVTVLGNTGGLTKSGCSFEGWNTKTDGTGINRTAGAIFIMEDEDVTLYAKWADVGSGRRSHRHKKETPSEEDMSVTVNGQAQQQVAIVSTETRNGRTVSTVILDTEKMSETVNSGQDGSKVTVPITGTADVAVSKLNGDLIKVMENKQTVMEIKTDQATYTLPAQQIDIDAVYSEFGRDVSLSDITVSIEIAKTSEEKVKIIEDTASEGNFSIVVPPVDFSVKCTCGDKTVDISSFNSYVQRAVAIPDDADPSKITTAVVVDPDGTLRHVPTKVIVIDGKYYAQINSLTNSSYSVIWNPVEFEDVIDHWAKEAVNDMGSRMIISGVGKNRFDPDREITRAEFAAIIARGLGLKPGQGNNPFEDVNEDAWYCDFVRTSAEYGIISGYGNGKFGPMDKITREQAMVMIERAMKICELESEAGEDETESLLAAFDDSGQAAKWAKESMAACIKSDIISGKSSTMLGPKDKITRAEVAVIIRRLLQKSSLI